MKYPRRKDIEEHKDVLWTSLVQYFLGLVPFQNVVQSLKALMGDAALWVNNNHKPVDLEKVKDLIASLKVSE